MPRGQLNFVLRRIRTLMAASDFEHWTDADLVRRFAENRDDAAFAVLVQRHGGLVLKVCRHVLRTDADAEDAFQATFLILARKASRCQTERSLASWLHGIAFHCARNVSKSAMRRDRRERSAKSARTPESPAMQAALHELQAMLDEEIERLPQKYRGPFILCCLEGKSRADAAQMLGCKEGTLASRLATAREFLQERLSARGVTWSAVLGAASLSSAAMSASVPTALAQRTTDAAVAFAAGHATAVSAQALAVAKGVMKSMLVAKLNSLAIVMLAISLTASALGGLIAQSGSDKARNPIAKSSPPRQAVNEKDGPRDNDQPHVDGRGDSLPEAALVRLGSAKWRHGGLIRMSTLAPDGKTLATVGERDIALWDLGSGRVIRRLPCDRADTWVRPGLTFSPDGTRLAHCRSGHFACVWDLRDGKEILRIEIPSSDGHNHFGTESRFVEGGKKLLICSASGVEIYDIDSKKKTGSYPTSARDLLPDGKTYLSVNENVPFFGDLVTGKEIIRLDAVVHNEGFRDLIAFSKDNQSFALLHDHREIQHRKLPSGEILASFPLSAAVLDAFDKRNTSSSSWQYHLDMSADGCHLAMGTRHGVIYRWDLAAKKELSPLATLADEVTGSHALPDGRTLISTSADGVIRFWDLTTAKSTVKAAQYAGRTSAAFSANGSWAAIGDGKGRVDLWDARSGNWLRTLQGEGPRAAQLAFSPDGKQLAMAELSGTVKFWSVPFGTPGAILPRKSTNRYAHCMGIHFSPDGRLLAVGVYPEELRVIEVASGRVVWTAPGPHGAFTSDGKTLIVAAGSSRLTFIDLESWKNRSTTLLKSDRPDQEGFPFKIAFPPDGRTLAVIFDGGCLALCDGRTGEEKFRLVDYDEFNEELRVIRGAPDRKDRAEAIAFSADGKWLASGGSDAIVSIWEAATGKEVLRLHGHDGDISALAFSPDGRTLLSFAQDAQGYRWKLDPAPSASVRPPVVELWNALDQADAAAAYRAQWHMVAQAKDSVALLRQRLGPIPAIESAKIRQWIVDIDSPKFPVRDAATKALEDAGPQVQGFIEKALAGEASLETRRRLARIAKKHDATPLVVRTGRALQVLELIDSPETRAVLEVIASGAAGARETEAAAASLRRLSQ
jgi:RNA polymerase sigma factor (sigma-70 family)